MLDLERRGGRTAYTGRGRPGQHADCGRRGRRRHRGAQGHELQPLPNADLNWGTHSDCIFLDGAERRMGVHTALLRHSHGSACCYEVGHKNLQCSISLEWPHRLVLVRAHN